MKQDIILIGGGGHCKGCIDVIEMEGRYNIIGISDQKELLGQKVLGYDISFCDDELASLAQKNISFLLTIGQIRSAQKRVELFAYLCHLQAKIATVISPLAYVSKSATIGQGSIVMHQALINADAKIGQNCIINTKALIEHDVIVGDHCHIATSGVVNGGVVMENEAFVGSGAVCKEYTHIKHNEFIRANSIYKG